MTGPWLMRPPESVDAKIQRLMRLCATDYPAEGRDRPCGLKIESASRAGIRAAGIHCGIHGKQTDRTRGGGNRGCRDRQARQAGWAGTDLTAKVRPAVNAQLVNGAVNAGPKNAVNAGITRERVQ